MADPKKGKEYKMTWDSADIPGILNFGSQINTGETETSDFDSGKFKEFIPADSDGTFSLELQFEPGDSDQETMISDWESQVVATATIEPVTPASGDRTLSVSAFATNVSDSYQKEDVIAFTVDFRMTGEPTISYTS